MMAKYEDYTKEQLLEEIKKLNQQKKFGLVWEEKTEDVAEQCKANFPVLQEIPERAIVAENEPTHLIIEGDNYHSLSVLNVTHKGKIDVIYIDPPYNTGNKDFKYNDDYVDKEDSFRHSKWLSFMEKRLVLAKELLSEKGVIFISIDDNEQAHLKLLCDEVFGEDNFIALLTIETGEVFGTKAAHINKTFVKVKDYVLVYASSENIVAKQPLYDSMRELFDSHFNTIVNQGLKKETLSNHLQKVRWVKDLFQSNNLRINASNISKLMTVNEGFRNYIYNEISEVLYTDQPYTKQIDNAVLADKQNGELFLFEDRIIFKTQTGSVRMLQKFKDSIRNSDDFISVFSRCSIRGDLWKGFHFDMRNIQDEGGIAFKNGKKPIRLIKQLVKWNNVENAVILDFFAGSGTTGHAVLELNKEDGGNRQFILCTNNENGICEEVTYPRIKKVAEGYADKSAIPANVRYFKTDFVPKQSANNVSDEDRINLTCKAGAMLAVKENVFEQKELNDWWQIFENSEKILAVYFKESKAKIKDLIKEIGDKKCVLYIFGWGKNEYAEEYGTENIEVKDIPEPILKIYKQINGRKK